MLEKIASSLWHSLTPFISKSYISTNWHVDLVEFATHLSLVFTNDAFSALAEIRVYSITPVYIKIKTIYIMLQIIKKLLK